MTQTTHSPDRCPACHEADPRPVWLATRPLRFEVRRCGRCELVFTVPVLSPDEVLAFYDESYYGRDNVRFNRWFERLVIWFRRRRADRICRFAPPGRVLDIGCGRGHILATLRERGWQVQGVELNEAAVQHARDRLGLDVTVRPFHADDFPPEHFDVVILWHVLEHLPNIGAALDGCAKILKPSGLLVIAVPNIASWQATFARYDWFHLDLPRHYAHFSDRWLRDKLERRGFAIREVAHFAFEQNPYGWIQSVLNRCGFRTNLLYDILKSTSARTIKHPIREAPFQAFACLVGFALMLPLAVFMLLPEALFRRGATIELYAVRGAAPPATRSD